MFEHLPGEALSLLQAAWNLERDRPECRGLVNARHVTSVLLSLTAKGRVEEAEGLLARMIQRYEDDSNDSLSPSRRHFGIVMHGYARRESPDSLRKAESILTRLEDLLVRGKHLPGDSEENNRVVYNILLTAYLQAWPNDAVVSIRRILNRMKRLAMGLKKPELLPDSISYAILMNALIRHGAPGYEEEVESILESMKQESRKAAQPRMHCYAAALEAWAKSDDPRAIAKAMAILDSIKSPSTACFNIVLNAYATRGLLDDAVQLLKRMEENFESGRNKNCQPDSITYSVTLNTYAKQGLVDEAVEILKRMKDEFESGRNQTCEPDSIAYLSVLHSLSSYAHETTSRRWEKALTCFDDMCESFRRGNPRCRPDQATITALLHVLRTCDDVTAKHVAAREVLERLVRLGLPQGPCIARSFILACGETVGPYDVRSEAMQIIWGLLRSLSAEQLDADMYRDVLESCHNLLFDRIDEKNRLIEDVFGQCTRTGHVSLLLLQTLFRISPPDLYSALTSHEAGRAPGFATIPDHWKRNVR
jgi:pentatricopeptide repeat protein